MFLDLNRTQYNEIENARRVRYTYDNFDSRTGYQDRPKMNTEIEKREDNILLAENCTNKRFIVDISVTVGIDQDRWSDFKANMRTHEPI